MKGVILMEHGEVLYKLHSKEACGAIILEESRDCIFSCMLRHCNTRCLERLANTQYMELLENII